MIRVAIVDDDPHLRAALAEELNAGTSISVCAQAGTLVDGQAVIDAGGFDVLLVDLGLPDGSGVDLIRREAALARDTDIIVISQFADQKKVLDSIRAGARGYLLKDQHSGDAVRAIEEIRRGGSPISPMIARQLVEELGPTPPKALPPVSPLSEREHEVLNLLARGFTYAESAEILRVSANTIGFHVKNIYRKLEVNSRAEAIFEISNQTRRQTS